MRTRTCTGGGRRHVTAAAAAETPLLSSTEAFLQQDRQRRSEEYARHAMNMFAAAKQMLLAQVEGRWAPVSLDALLERHKAKARKASKTF